MTETEGRARGSVRPITEAIGLTVGAFVVSLLAGVAFIVPLVALGYDIAATWILLGSTAIGQVAFLGIGYAYVRARDVAVGVGRPSRRDSLAVLGGTVLAIAVAVALSAVLAALDLLPGSVIAEVATTDPRFLLGLAVLSVVIVAPAEELLFRGAIQGRLRQRFGPRASVVGSSLLFGSMHLANYTGALGPIVAGAVLIAAVGAVFGALYEYTDNLAVPVATHAVYNAVLLVVSYVTL